MIQHEAPHHRRFWHRQHRRPVLKERPRLCELVITRAREGGPCLGCVFVESGEQRAGACGRLRLLHLVDLIGKWSMADVLVIGVFLAYLATQDQAQANVFEFALLGNPMEVSMLTYVKSTLGAGFCFFLGYCLFSIFWTQMLKHRLLTASV
jgi:hypothetical protein